jgi:N-acetylmuramoyl-L-alanine amidase
MIGNSKREPVHKLWVLSICSMVAFIFTVIVPLQSTEASSVIGINLDGKDLQVPQSLISNVDGRVYVPIRIIAQSLGAQVEWDKKQQKVTFSNGDRAVNLWIGSEQYKVNGVTKEMDAKPFIQQQRTLVPVRFAANGLNVNVRWDPSTSRVMLNQLGLHTVMKDESLFFIGRALETTAEELIRLNELTSDRITPGQVLVVPKQKYVQDTVIPSTVHPNVGTMENSMTMTLEANEEDASSDDLYWLAKIIYTEARGEPVLGQVAVGAVVLNRVKSPGFPNNVYDVIFDKWDIYYQFEPVQNGEIHRLEPNEASYAAARRALTGEDPTNGALFFHNPTISKSAWMAAKPVTIRIGKHEFMY